MSIRFLRLTALTLPLLGSMACASSPPYAGMSADDLFAMGQREFQEEDWDEAADVLDHLLLRVADASFTRAAEARFMLAQAYFNKEEYLTAQSEFNRFLDRHRGHEMAPQAALGMCRSFAGLSHIPERDPTYTEQAVIVCQNVALDWSGVDDEVAEEARQVVNEMRGKLGEKVYLNAQQYYGMDADDSALIYFELVVDLYGDTEWAPRAIARMIEIYEELGYQDEVAQWRNTLLASYPDSPEARAINGLPPDTGSIGGGAPGTAAAASAAAPPVGA